jgi:DNA-binding FadR family transcriptional regulator
MTTENQRSSRVGSDGDRSRRLELRPIEAVRAHEQVAGELRRNIALRFVGPGEPLPPDRDLAKAFGVGRATVQAAVRLLEIEGLVESRRGRRGGTFVLKQHGGDLAREHLLVDLRGNSDLIVAAVEFRNTIEPAAAALAAQVREADALDALSRAAQAERDAGVDSEILRWDTALHLSVAAATGNAFYMEAVERIRLSLEDAFAVLPESPQMRRAIHSDHTKIVKAIEAGEPSPARSAMKRHVEKTGDGILKMLESL